MKDSFDMKSLPKLGTVKKTVRRKTGKWDAESRRHEIKELTADLRKSRIPAKKAHKFARYVVNRERDA